MPYQSWIILFVVIVSVLFFIFLNGGLKGSGAMLVDVFSSPTARTFLFLGVLFALLVVLGAGCRS